MDLSKSHVIFKNQYVRKLVSLKDICRNEFSFIRIVLKLTFLFQLFKKFRENIICPMKAKSTISAEIFFRETFSGYSIEIDNSVYFLRRHNRFWKSNYLIGENFVGQNFSSFFSDKNFYLYVKKVTYEKRWLQLQNLVILLEFLSYIKYLMIASYNWWKFIPWYCLNTILKCHYANTMFSWKYYEYVSTRVFKIAVQKTTSK